MYKHINDCWNAIGGLVENPNATPDDLENLLKEFPRKFGDWSWEVHKYDDYSEITVTNMYWENGEFYEDEEDYEVNEVFINSYIKE